jgi:hypothetical protein
LTKRRDVSSQPFENPFLPRYSASLVPQPDAVRLRHRTSGDVVLNIPAINPASVINHP